MNFSELEQIMYSHGIATLADIARALETTPQAVSNWKARNQIPHHIVAKINKNIIDSSYAEGYSKSHGNEKSVNKTAFSLDAGEITLSDIILIVAEQIKVIFMTSFVSVFLIFTYVQFIKQPLYVSSATVLLPMSQADKITGGALSGLASQFGVNIPNSAEADLSSPTLYPDILVSRTFARIILFKNFYSKKFNKELPLLSIINDVDSYLDDSNEELISKASNVLRGEMFFFEKDPLTSISTLRVTAKEPLLAKELANVVLTELEALNRDYKIKSIKEKISFIENRIFSVKQDLEDAEKTLTLFRESNRQVSSPSLRLEEDRFERNLEIHKEIYLTLKQQLELAKIEEVQKASIVQILDGPELPLGPSNKRLVFSTLVAGFLGTSLGVIISILRALLNDSDKYQRKKIRRFKHLLKIKIQSLIKDIRITGIISLLMIICLPFYLGYQSKIPVFFGMYSAKLMIINSLYILILIISLGLFLFNLEFFKKKNRNN